MQKQFKIAIGCDLAGYDFKEEVKKILVEKGYDVTDYGCFSSNEGEYPYHARLVAKATVEDDMTRGVLICGTGQGVNMAANKVRGARSALVFSNFAALLAREHNDARVICTGAWLNTVPAFIEQVEIFLFGKYAGGKHEKRIQALKDIENE